MESALAEDVGSGDITTDSCIQAELQAEARFVAREAMTVAGAELLGLLFDAPLIKLASGARAVAGQEIACARGAARLLLSRERVALNFFQRLSGVATVAARFVAAVEGTGVRIQDTRKTTPGLRVLEKMAAGWPMSRDPDCKYPGCNGTGTIWNGKKVIKCPRCG